MVLRDILLLRLVLLLSKAASPLIVMDHGLSTAVIVVVGVPAATNSGLVPGIALHADKHAWVNDWLSLH